MPDPIGIAGVDKDLFEHVWALVKQLDEREKHFNDLQSRYRALASTWLLAAFAGIGFVFTQTVTAPWPREVIAVAIALAGAVGITLLWVLDVLVYHELLIAGYVVGKRLEERYAWLPPVRTNFSKLTKRPAVRWYIAIFYIAGITILCSLAAAICWSCLGAWSGGILLLVAVILDAIVVSMTSRALTMKRKQLEKQLQSWPPDAPSQPPNPPLQPTSGAGASP